MVLFFISKIQTLISKWEERKTLHDSNQREQHEHVHGYDDADQRLLYHAMLHALNQVPISGN
ncbi:MAG: hypothetical protein HFI72_05485 [Peptococcaceae bacterium]|nr:hypothetical protein [Peptococcaceae bacterium]